MPAIEPSRSLPPSGSAGPARVPVGRTQGTGPWARRTIFVAFREAAIDQWGEAGLEAIADLLPPDARADLVQGAIARAEFFPERYVVDWVDAAWNGPARAQMPEFNRHVCGMMACGFGRVRRLMLSMFAPPALVSRCGELWEHDHTTGTLTGEMTGRGFTLRLSGHVYTTTPLLRQMTAELLRYAGSCMRGVKNAVEQHNVDPSGALVVHIQWTS